VKIVLGSWVIKIIALLGGYVAALSIVRALSRPFNHYIRGDIGDFLRMGIAVAIPLFIAFTALLFVSVWVSKGEKSPVWRKIDLFMWIALTFCTVMLCMHYALYIRASRFNMTLLLLSLIVYITVMVLLMEVAARIRDKDFSLYWTRFFKLYPVWKPIGLLMALLLAGNLLWVIFFGVRSTPPLLFMAFIFIVLTYICTFILSLSAEYDKANIEKIRAERFKAELITNVSHDIRTPLTSIINYVDLLKALPVEHADFTEYVGVLDKKSARLKTLIGDLMEASKASTGNMSVDLIDIDVSELVGQIAGEFDDQFAERKLTLVLRQPDEPAIAKADNGHLWRTLENLFGNVAKYALPGTRVFAEIGLRDGGTIFSLKNTSQNPIDRSGDTLTEQFIRGDRARRTEGSGLGLYIAKSLVELMGGRFTIQASGDLFEVEIVLSC
jgi:signal transduction histidine kinase